MCPVNAYDALQVIHHRYLSLITLSMLTQTGLPDKCGSSSKHPQLQSPHESQPASGIFQYSMLSTNLWTKWRKKRGGCGSRHREAWNLVRKWQRCDKYKYNAGKRSLDKTQYIWLFCLYSLAGVPLYFNCETEDIRQPQSIPRYSLVP